MKLSEMRQLLDGARLQLTKSLGQNFLYDNNQLLRIVAAADLHPGDRVLEIGPGLGPLTEALLNAGARVLAIEKDARLVELLRDRLGNAAHLELVTADALDHLRQNPHDWSDWKLVANLPYSVASPILVELAEAEKPPSRLVATLQLEVARRLMAGPDNADYGVLTLLVQLRYEPCGMFVIPAGCFFPEPDVDSACVTLVRRAQPMIEQELEPVFKRIVKRAFSQRRKMMFKLLKAEWPVSKLTEAFRRTGLDERVRGEAVGLEGFVALTKCLNSSGAPLSEPAS
jgi:16S rRNA (adenine1518-N6/adenine1519-N6)-dimethyltransferase